MFYKGFIETDGKKAKESFKNKKRFKKLNQVEECDSYAGVLADDTILVDVDDQEEAEIVFRIIKDKKIKCRVLKTTRGMHFLFKNNSIDRNKTHAVTALGITADVKIGARNSYQCLKYNGVERDVIYDDGESYLPKFLFPINKKVNLKDLSEGDGRNQTLFNYILPLQSNGFSEDEIKEIIHLVNEYVLNEPLPENEIETILRDEAFKKNVFLKGSTFLFNEFALFLIQKYSIKRINGVLHYYNNRIYESGYANLENLMIKEIPVLSRTKRQEVLAYLEIQIREDTPLASARYIAFKNCIYDIENKTIQDFDKSIVITNVINYDFNPKAYSVAVDEVLNNISCKNKDIRYVLEEMVGYCLYRRNELGKAFVLIGEGSNGKSTFLNMVKNMLGYKNISVLDIKKLNDRFSTVMLMNKLANIGDDISDEFITDSAEFKKIITGEMIDAEFKGKDKFQFEPFVKLIFSANNLPRIGKGCDSSAILRRLVIIPFNAVFNKQKLGSNYKPFIADDLKSSDSMEYLIQLGLGGLDRVLTNREFTTTDEIENELKDYEKRNNPLIEFLEELTVEDVDGHRVDEVYLQYRVWCEESSVKSISRIEFSRIINKNFNMVTKVKKIDGKSKRIYVLIDA